MGVREREQKGEMYVEENGRVGEIVSVFKALSLEKFVE